MCDKCIHNDATLIHPWVDVFMTMSNILGQDLHPLGIPERNDLSLTLRHCRVVHDLYLTPGQTCSSAHHWLQGYKVLVQIGNAAFLNQGLAEEEKKKPFWYTIMTLKCAIYLSLDMNTNPLILLCYFYFCIVNAEPYTNSKTSRMGWAGWMGWGGKCCFAV